MPCENLGDPTLGATRALFYSLATVASTFDSTMSSPDSNPNEAEKDESVGLSVKGQYFIIKKSTIESYDWILSKILTSEIAWEKTSDNGQIYLDVDPISFRIILGILDGTFDISQDVPNLSRPELALLKSTTRYLMLDDVYEELQGFETCMMTEVKAALGKKDAVIAARDEMIAAKEREIESMKQKSAKFDEIEAQIARLTIRTLKCNAFCQRRRDNRCGFESMILGALVPENPGAPCGHCPNHRDAICLYRGSQMKDTLRPVRNVDEFVRILRNLERNLG